ncbi:MAG: DUF370 domain-containing protein [Tissierellia bacterium]|nr:DUF370 domain-containing protein [Tissierellia bacterium]
MSNLISVGFDNYIVKDRIIAVLNPESAPMKRMIQQAKEKSIAIDVTFGRKMRSVIVTDDGKIIISAIQPETICQRFDGQGIKKGDM